MEENLNIVINNNIITLNVINEQIIKPYKQFLKEKKSVVNLVIRFSKTVKRLDELFYAYIGLIAKKNNINSVKLFFSNEEASSKVLQLSQQYAGVLRKQPYLISLEVRNKEEKLPYYFKGSKEFLPLLLINQDQYFRLFIKKRNNIKDITTYISRLQEKDKFNNVFNEITRKEEFKNAVLKSLSDSNAINYAWRYMFQAFSQLNVLRYILQKSYNKTVSVSLKKSNEFNFGRIKKGNRATQFSEDISQTLIENQFYKFNYFQVFIFSILVQNSNLFDSSSLKNPNGGTQEFDVYKKQYLSHLKYIINYTKDISLGIEELVKNITEHVFGSEFDYKGAITVRILSKEGFNDITNTEKNPALLAWRDYTLEKKTNILQINVIDLGEESVLETYQKNISTLISSSDNDTNSILLKDDLQSIKNNNFSIAHFLDFTNIYLTHQIKRVYSRLGLLVFSNLILKKKNGIIKSSSFGLNDISSSSFISYKNKAININSEAIKNTIELGTSYNINIPVNESFDEYREIDVIKEPVSNYASTDSTLFVELFKYRSGNIETDFSDAIALLNIDLSKITETDKYKKIKEAKYLIGQSIVGTKNANDVVIVIDAKQSSTIMNNSSDWIRLLASLHLENPEAKNNIIIKNIEEDIYAEIIGLNKLFKDTDFGFWSDNEFILFYVEVINKGYTFYFNDVLTSKNYLKYIKLNRNISNYHLNMVSINDPDYNEKDLPKENIISSNNILKEGKLLNFELLLNANEHLTLYEKTAQSFLNLEIKDKI